MTLGIRAPEADDRDRMLEWRNLPRVRAVSTNDREITADEHAAWFSAMLEHRRDQMLIVTADDQPVGTVQLEQLDLDQRVSAWGVHLGNTSVHPATGATLPVLGLALGFGRFHLRRMSAVVLSVNSNMLGMHRRLGITEEGLRRQAIRRADGTLADAHEYGVLEDEWRNVVDRCQRVLPSAIRHDLMALVEELAPVGQ